MPDNNTIRIKRRASGGAGAPSSLQNAELAFNEVDDTLYYGKGTGGAGGSATTVDAIAGKGAVVMLTGNQTIAGTKTFSSAPVIPGYVATSVQIITAANSGLAGGADLTANVTLTVDANNLTTVTSAASSDFVVIYDGSGTKKVTKANFVSNLGGGTVTSVAVSLPAIFDVTGSPITSAGTITATLASQSANQIFAAPNGSSGAPGFRALVAADIPTITSAKVSDFDTQVRTSRLDQMAAPTTSVSFNSQRITNLLNPSSDQDAATKAYVDAARSGLDVKQSVKCATTANITLSGEQTIDGVTTSSSRVLVKNQSTASENGLYDSNSSSWTRCTDADSSTEVTSGMFTFVEEGTTNGDSGWVLTTDGSITLGSTSLAFVQFSGAGQIVAGGGLTKTGNTLDVGGTTNRITINADSIDISSSYVGQTSITTLGTITTGTWTGTTIAVANGGTGATDASGARTNLGLGTMATQNASAVAITGGTIDNVTIDGGSF